MPTSATSPTNTTWTHEFDTVRREKLFRDPPKDHSAYPALQNAISPHVESFNALFETDGLVAQGLLDIGTRTFLDGDERAAPAGKNMLAIRFKEILVEKSVLPPSNKFSTRNREILPAECRERHVTYRGKMLARMEYRVNNGDWKEFIRDVGQLPLMLKVRTAHCLTGRILLMFLVKSMSFRKQLSCPTRSTERRS
jgi:DNA-directed RNA polymerase I subunit RPA2